MTELATAVSGKGGRMRLLGLSLAQLVLVGALLMEKSVASSVTSEYLLPGISLRASETVIRANKIELVFGKGDAAVQCLFSKATSKWGIENSVLRLQNNAGCGNGEMGLTEVRIPRRPSAGKVVGFGLVAGVLSGLTWAAHNVEGNEEPVPVIFADLVRPVLIGAAVGPIVIYFLDRLLIGSWKTVYSLERESEQPALPEKL